MTYPAWLSTTPVPLSLPVREVSQAAEFDRAQLDHEERTKREAMKKVSTAKDGRKRGGDMRGAQKMADMFADMARRGETLAERRYRQTREKYWRKQVRLVEKKLGIPKL